MKLPLKEPVCSLALAQRLKELGVPQESEYCWVDGVIQRWDPSIKEYVSAYTDEEIYELSPTEMPPSRHRYGLEVVETGNEYHVYFREGINVFDDVIFDAVTAVDARAQMLIYLLEKGYHDPKKELINLPTQHC